ncbi:MAG: universal stress protein [Alphaproteobacteria bacterium]
MLGEETRSGAEETSGPTARVPGRLKFLVCVDHRRQSRVALRFACRRARNTGGTVSLLHVIEPPEFQHWMAVGDTMEGERREEAETLLQELSAEVNELAGIMPELVLRDGRVGEEILAQVAEDPTVDLLVVGAAAPDDKDFSLITFLAGKLVGHLPIPLVIVPGNLTDTEIDNMT